MASDFMVAFDYMIRNEDFELSGEVVIEPNGGKARFGINSTFHPQALDDNFYGMTRDTALSYCIKLHRKKHWEERGFDVIEEQRIATKLFDMAVAMGNKGEIVVLQRTLDISITGDFDGLTRAALEVAGPTFLDKLTNKLKSHYLALHEKRPDKYRYAVSGWLARAAKLPK